MQTLPHMQGNGPCFASKTACNSYIASMRAHARQHLHVNHRPQHPTRTQTRLAASHGEQEAKTEAQKLMEEAEALMQAMASGNYKPSPKKAAAAPEPVQLDPSTGLRLQCDVNGCVIVPLSAKQPRNGLTGKLEGRGVGSKNSQTPTAPADFQLAQGPGWKLGYDHRSRNPAAFSALVGGEDWSMTLSKYEYDDFIRLLKNLRHSVTTLEILGEWGTGARSEDEAALELKTDRIWMEGRAQQKRLSALQHCDCRSMQDFWTHGDQDGREVQHDADIAAFEIRFIVSSPNQRDVEGHFPPEVVTRVLDHLDAEDKAKSVAASIGSVKSAVTVNA